MTFSQRHNRFANIVRRDSRLRALFLSKDRPKTKVPGGSRVTSLNLRSHNSNCHPQRSSKRDERISILSRFEGAAPTFSKEIGWNKEAVARIYPRFWQRKTQELIPRPRRACTRRWSPEIEFLSLSLSLFRAPPLVLVLSLGLFNFHRRERQPRVLPPRLDFRQEE